VLRLIEVPQARVETALPDWLPFSEAVHADDEASRIFLQPPVAASCQRVGVELPQMTADVGHILRLWTRRSAAVGRDAHFLAKRVHLLPRKADCHQGAAVAMKADNQHSRTTLQLLAVFVAAWAMLPGSSAAANPSNLVDQGSVALPPIPVVRGQAKVAPPAAPAERAPSNSSAPELTFNPKKP
jgi:hypothetical protein